MNLVDVANLFQPPAIIPQHLPQCVGEVFRKEILNVFAGSNEVEHRHALRQRYEEGCEQAEKDVLRDVVPRQTDVNRDQKANDRQQGSRQ